MQLFNLMSFATLGAAAALPNLLIEVFRPGFLSEMRFELTSPQQSPQANPVCPEPVEKYCWTEGMAKAPADTMLWFIGCEKNMWTCLYIKPGNFDPTPLLPPGGPYNCTGPAPGAEAVRCAHTGVGWKEN